MQENIENIEKFCPNMFYSDDDKTIGEFRTLEECMAFPIQNIWCINRTEYNLFEKYKNNGYRLFIICCWDMDIDDVHRYVVCLVSKNKAVKYFDSADLPMDLEKEEFEKYLGEEALNAMKQQLNNQITEQCKPKAPNASSQIRNITRTELRQIVREETMKLLSKLIK